MVKVGSTCDFGYERAVSKAQHERSTKVEARTRSYSQQSQKRQFSLKCLVSLLTTRWRQKGWGGAAQHSEVAAFLLLLDAGHDQVAHAFVRVANAETLVLILAAPLVGDRELFARLRVLPDLPLLQAIVFAAVVSALFSFSVGMCVDGALVSRHNTRMCTRRAEDFNLNF